MAGLGGSIAGPATTQLHLLEEVGSDAIIETVKALLSKGPARSLKVLATSRCLLSAGTVDAPRDGAAVAVLVHCSLSGQRWLVCLEATVSGTRPFATLPTVDTDAVLGCATKLLDSTSTTSVPRAAVGLQFVHRAAAEEMMNAANSGGSGGGGSSKSADSYHPQTTLLSARYCVLRRVTAAFAMELISIFKQRPQVTLLPSSAVETFNNVGSLRERILNAQQQLKSSSGAAKEGGSEATKLLMEPSVVEAFRMVSLDGRSVLASLSRADISIKATAFPCQVPIAKSPMAAHALYGQKDLVGGGWRNRLLVLFSRGVLLVNAVTAQHLARPLSGAFFTLSCVTGVILDSSREGLAHLVCTGECGSRVVVRVEFPSSAARSDFSRRLVELVPTVVVEAGSNQPELGVDAALLQFPQALVDVAATLQAVDAMDADDGEPNAPRPRSRSLRKKSSDAVSHPAAATPDDMQLVWRALWCYPVPFLTALSYACRNADDATVGAAADTIRRCSDAMVGSAASSGIALVCLTAISALERRVDALEPVAQIPPAAMLLFELLLRWCSTMKLNERHDNGHALANNADARFVAAVVHRNASKTHWLAFAISVAQGRPIGEVAALEERIRDVGANATDSEMTVKLPAWSALVPPSVWIADGSDKNPLVAAAAVAAVDSAADGWNLVRVPSAALTARHPLSALVQLVDGLGVDMALYLCERQADTTSFSAVMHRAKQATREGSASDLVRHVATQADPDPAWAAQMRAQLFFDAHPPPVAMMSPDSFLSPEGNPSGDASPMLMSPTGARATSVRIHSASPLAAAADLNDDDLAVELTVAHKETEMLRDALLAATANVARRDHLLEAAHAEIEKLKADNAGLRSSVLGLTKKIATLELGAAATQAAQGGHRDALNLFEQEEALARRELSIREEQARFHHFAALTQRALLIATREITQPRQK